MTTFSIPNDYIFYPNDYTFYPNDYTFYPNDYIADTDVVITT